MKICILIGSADISGGTGVIFEHALHLAAVGHEVTIAPLLPQEAAASGWHRGLERLRFDDLETVAKERFDLALATWWRTVYELPRIQADRYAYFVQSIESRFYPGGSAAWHLADATYDLGLPMITIARWMRDHLRRRTRAARVALVRNGCDKRLFRPEGTIISPRQPGRLRVLVEGALGVDFKNVARTIRLLRPSAADEIWLLTPTPISRYPGVARVFSRVSGERAAAIYRSCDALVKLSVVEGMFGPPLEMFHCGGTAVVWEVTGADEYIAPERNALMCAAGDEAGVIAAVNRLKSDPALLERLQAGARRTARVWPDWPDSGRRFATALEEIVTRPATVHGEELATRVRDAVRAHPETGASSLAGRALRAMWRRLPVLDEALRLAHAVLVEERRACTRRPDV